MGLDDLCLWRWVASVLRYTLCFFAVNDSWALQPTTPSTKLPNITLDSLNTPSLLAPAGQAVQPPLCGGGRARPHVWRP